MIYSLNQTFGLHKISSSIPRRMLFFDSSASRKSSSHSLCAKSSNMFGAPFLLLQVCFLFTLSEAKLSIIRPEAAAKDFNVSNIPVTAICKAYFFLFNLFLRIFVDNFDVYGFKERRDLFLYGDYNYELLLDEVHEGSDQYLLWGCLWQSGLFFYLLSFSC